MRNIYRKLRESSLALLARKRWTDDFELMLLGRAAVLENLRNMPFAPSAQMQHVPYDVDDDEGDSDSDLDVRISRTFFLSPFSFSYPI